MTAGTFAAVDLGASSGRVMVGLVAPGRLELHEVHRFPNEPVALPDGLHWDCLRIYHEVLDGLRRAGRADGQLSSIGIDTWGVDYGLIDADGRLLGNPYHYRDGRTAAGAEAVHRVISHERLYPRNGLQFMPFNTVYQLVAGRDTVELGGAATMLLMPDLLAYWLSGVIGAEETNASTTGLLRVQDRTWDLALLDELDLPRSILPALRRPGEVLGGLARKFWLRPAFPTRYVLPWWVPTTPRPPSSACRRRGGISPTSHPGPGRWSEWNWMRRSRPTPAEWPASRMRAASTVGFAITAT